MTRVCLVVLVWLCSWVLAFESTTDGEARALLAEFEAAAAKAYNTVNLKTWAFLTNITDHNREIAVEEMFVMSKFQEEWNNKVPFSLHRDVSPEITRAMSMAFPAQLDPADFKNLNSMMASLHAMYSTTTVCLTPKSCVGLRPDLTRKMAESRNYDELKFIWKSWRTNVSRKMRPLYLQFMDFVDNFISQEVEEDILNLYKELDALYRLVHAFVRKRLRLVYPQIKARGHLPACVLGSMSGSAWTNIFPLVEPYSEAADMDVTSAMLKQNYTVKRMFTMGEEFFTSMGLEPLPATFWERSMLERPQDGRNVSCHPTAWDFIDGKDFRIKMCTEVNFDHLATIHHELGHIQYFIQYAHQPLTYRGGANDGFHEAIGELMSMSMSTRKHLAKVGLLEDVPENTETSINFLLRTALLSVTTLPFHLVNDLWRWRAFRGEYDLRDYNTNYWKLKEQYLGVEAPVNRTDEDLDPPAIFHISSDYDMIRYFTRTILQFQFFEKLCEAAGHEGPLHTCDFYGSKEAGNLLAKMLSMGSSKPWQDVLEVMTGERHMNPRPLLRYFQPLQQWLLEDNIKDGDGVGWGDSWALLDSKILHNLQ